MTAPEQEVPLGVDAAPAPTRVTKAELLSFAVNAEGVVKLTTIGAEFACPAVSGPVLVTVKLVIAAAFEGSELKEDRGKASPIAKADAKRNEEDRVSN